jgi:hypothetical protein
MEKSYFQRRVVLMKQYSKTSFAIYTYNITQSIKDRLITIFFYIHTKMNNQDSLPSVFTLDRDESETIISSKSPEHLFKK